MKQRLKTNGLIIALFTAAVALAPSLFVRHSDPYFIEIAAEYLGMWCILSGQLLRVCARGFKAECSGQSTRLVRDGPYGMVRNPMYLGIILIGAGINLMLFQLWIAPVFCAAFIMRYARLIRREERKLHEAFPGSYPAYKRAVPCLFPSPAALYSRNVQSYIPLKPAWFKREIRSIIPVLAAVFVIDAVFDIREYGIFRYASAWMVLTLVFIAFSLIVLYLIRMTVSHD